MTPEEEKDKLEREGKKQLMIDAKPFAAAKPSDFKQKLINL